MKTKFFWAGIIALALLPVFALGGCDNGTTDPEIVDDINGYIVTTYTVTVGGDVVFTCTGGGGGGGGGSTQIDSGGRGADGHPSKVTVNRRELAYAAAGRGGAAGEKNAALLRSGAAGEDGSTVTTETITLNVGDVVVFFEGKGGAGGRGGGPSGTDGGPAAITGTGKGGQGGEGYHGFYYNGVWLTKGGDGGESGIISYTGPAVLYSN